VAFDPDSRLVLEVVVGKRLDTNAEELLQGVKKRLGEVPPKRVSSDGHAPCPGAVLAAFGGVVTPPRTGQPGRPAGPRVEPAAGLCYGRVVKRKRQGRVVGVDTEVVLGQLPEGAKVSTS
jgi:hypothetical protein